MKYTCIDLFAGCGGLSLGLAQAGFEHLFAIESHPHAFATYHHNLVAGKPFEHSWPEWLNQSSHDILHVLSQHKAQLKDLRGRVDLIAGGPPCQGFSMNGRRDPKDPRSQLINAYLEFVDLVRPRVVLLENVQGFVSMPHQSFGTYPNFAKAKLTELGYEPYETIVSASDFGVPQRRSRYLLFGVQRELMSDLNPVEHLFARRIPFLETLGLGLEPIQAFHALCDLETKNRKLIQDPDFGELGFSSLDYKVPSQKSPYLRLMRDGNKRRPSDMRLARHSDGVVKRFQDILDNCKRGQAISSEDRDRYKIKKRSITPLDPLQPAPTITTLPDDLVHYSEPRIMTVREHARLQSFPDWFQFCGPYTTGGKRRKFDCPRYTQVGNAVPPLLARAVGEMILSLLTAQNLRDIPNGSKVA